MGEFSTEAFIQTLALVGAVILISALLSGVIDRTGLPQVAVFLALGAALGPGGLGMLHITLDSPVLRVIATLSLALVLFTDAVNLNLAEVRRHSRLGLRVLGPGSLLSTILITLAAWWLLDLSLPAATILGAALASTDPVLLRDFLRRRDVPASTRQALRLESGLNDVVLLPIVIVAMEFLRPAGEYDLAHWGQLAINLLLLGPGAGVVIGLVSVATLEMVRARIGVRRDYESLYALGVAFSSFAAAEAVHGSGFLAAFAAGLTIVAFDVELCDCFLEYGETTAEMALLLTFVLLGSSLIWSGLELLTLSALAFALFVIFIRVPVYFGALAGSGLRPQGKWLIAWFGPRGLSSLLLILLPVFSGLPGSETLFALCCLVVLFSVAAHGGSLMAVTRRLIREGAGADGENVTQQEPRGPGGGASPIIPLHQRDIQPGDVKAEQEQPGETPLPRVEHHAAPIPRTIVLPGSDEERISIDQVQQLRQEGQHVQLLDVRTERTYDPSTEQAQGALRLHPDAAVTEARRLGLPRDSWNIAYCT